MVKGNLTMKMLRRSLLFIIYKCTFYFCKAHILKYVNVSKNIAHLIGFPSVQLQ